MNSTGHVNTSCTTNAAGNSNNVQYDLILYVTSDAKTCGTSAAAYASTCLMDVSTNRVLIGMINLCTVALNSYTSTMLLATTVHEITHVMGFANNQFPNWIDDNGDLLKVGNVSNVFQMIDSQPVPNRQQFSQIITPKALAEARDQFGCATLSGVPLEDGGGSGSAGSHWEYELFQVGGWGSRACG
jgi:hypothetical protein